MATKNKLAKLGFHSAEIIINADATNDYDTVTIKFPHESDRYESSIYVSFQRHRLDRNDNGKYVSEVLDLRASTAHGPFWDVGGAPYSAPYAATFREQTRATIDAVKRHLDVLKALDIEQYDTNLLGWLGALKAAGVPFSPVYWTGSGYGNRKQHAWVSDLPQNLRCPTNRWCYAPDACRLVATYEQERAERAEQRSREETMAVESWSSAE
jgi:hypothetical protein